MIGTVALSGALVVGMSTASAAPTLCAPAPSYGVGIAIIPEFVGTSDIAVSAYPGEVIDYDVTVFLKQDPPGTPNGIIVCPIFNGTVTVTLPNGAGPFTLDTKLALGVGQSKTYPNVPPTKYTMSTADLVPSPQCDHPPCPDRVDATAHVEATSDGPSTDPLDDDGVRATALAPTFLLAPSTQVSVAPNTPSVQAGQPVTWTVKETNNTPPKFFGVALTDAHVDLSTDGGATTFRTLDVSSPNFSGDANSDGQLDVGETWQWTFTTTPTANTTLTVTGFGNGPRGHVVTFPANADERAAAPVLVTPPPPPPPTAPPTSVPLLLPPTGPSPLIDASGIAGLAIALVGLLLVVVTRRRGRPHPPR
ncbi:MAG TPA: hypothetical protein VKD67_07110 [Acidimicrobiales bacterium]|nr:hypothetical protein [Acidimicrobiales bacterium]